MSARKKLKYSITKAVMEQLPSINLPIETVLNYWWYTKSGEGLRLTNKGDEMFRQANIEFFDLPVKTKDTSWYKFLTDCNNKIKCPYYFSVNKDAESKLREPYIRLYDSKIAMMLTLYGDIESYLESVKVRK